ITQEVENKTQRQITLYPYALISRHGKPTTAGLFILHEGLIGVLGDEGLQELSYSSVADAEGPTSFKATSGWLGITDKYWATALIPDQKTPYDASFRAWKVNNKELFQTDFLLGPVTVAPGAKQSVSSLLFAGAKQVGLIDSYNEQYNIKLFDRMIDWGWFWFFTKPLFYALDFFYKQVGNFGVAILLVTVLVKLAFFPLANKSYESMSKMKKLQPDMKRIQERYKDDRMKQQQELMALYKKEKVNPMSGCLPILVQIPVFFALYKVLYVTIEARHAPFFGWIQDLSAPDPTTIFNLFGLIPWSPPEFLIIGIWPLLMGVTMFIQMKLNPTPTDPIQQKIFTWMPVLFTFLLAPFSAGLVIYWTWNNALSILQQWVIMRRQGVEVNLLENMGFSRKSAGSTGKS
ncbi:MAG: membrane protein insertase YidC, partial [Rhodomicrobium sp.]|nr:membrane protein insertase YidC [Rhodomicrobium sp.]